MIDAVKDYICDLLDTTSLTKVRKNVLPLTGTMCASVRMTTKSAEYALAGNVITAELLCSVIVRGSDNAEETDSLVDEVSEKIELIQNITLTDGTKIYIGTQPIVSYIGEDENGNYTYNIDALMRVG
jgi:ethanolamine utilization cobalamin adenosyltransferase